MSREQKIKNILENRKPQAEKAKQVVENLGSCEAALRGMQAQMEQISSRFPEVNDSFANLHDETTKFFVSIAQQRKDFEQLASRFSRSTLNIGVIGQARQGKSTFLQQITGLADSEIPTGDKDHCTGAPSLVHHHLQDETYALVDFHTPNTFIQDVLTPYFNALGLPLPRSIEAFSASELSSDSTNDNFKENVLEKLRNLQSHLSQYQNLIGTSQRKISREEIRSYIAQETQSGEKIYNWMAVKVVNIYCRFTKTDLGSIAVADTPGTGDFIPGAEDRLMKTVGDNLDILLFLKRPAPTGAIVKPEDSKLYDCGRAAIPELSSKIDQWSYYLINKSADNTDQIEFFRDQLDGKGIKTRLQIPTDCLNQEEVNHALEVILDDATNNLSRIDSFLYETRLNQLQHLYDQLRSFCETAKRSLKIQGSQNIGIQGKLFKELHKNLSHAINQLFKSYQGRINDKDIDFMETFKLIESELNQGYPFSSDEEIEKDISSCGTVGNWYNETMNSARVRFAQAFRPFDDTFARSYDRIRTELLTIFLEQGKMKNLYAIQSLEESDTNTQWKCIVEQLDGLDGSELLISAIEQLLSARLSYANLIHPRVRAFMNSLDVDSVDRTYSYPGGSADLNTLKIMIQSAWAKTSQICLAEIEKMAKEPSMAKFATVEDFRDRILIESGNDQATENFRMIYEHLRSEIWVEEYGALEENQIIRKDWIQSIEKLEKTIITL